MTPEEALKLLDVHEPIEVAWVSKDGTKRDDNGEAIDERQTVPWVWALGPFGSWPVTLDKAMEKFDDESLDWCHLRSIRLGPVVCYELGWGYGAVSIDAKEER